MPDPRDTPAMRQHAAFKKQHPGCVLMFRMGDFYELFDQDAVEVSRAVGLTLTQRSEGLPMAGVPHHQLEVYLRRLISAGFRVAVCDQVQDPKEVKSGQIVARAVTRVLTPGTLVDESLLDDGVSNRLACVAFAGSGEEGPAGVAVIELSTGAFTVLDCPSAGLADELSRRSVSEVLFASTATGEAPPRIAKALSALGVAGTPRPAWQFRQSEAVDLIKKHFGVSTLAGWGLREDEACVAAAGAALVFLRETQTPEQPGVGPAGALVSGKQAALRNGPRATLAHLQPPRREDGGVGADGARNGTRRCVIDGVSLRALEVERTIRAARTGEAHAQGSLVWALLSTSGGGGCATSMGKRLLRDWLCRPLGERAAIEARQRCVAMLVSDRRTAEALRGALGGVQDVARIAGRAALGRATPRDVVALGRSVKQAAALATALAGAPACAEYVARIERARARLEPVAAEVVERCVDEPPQHLREGGLFRDGVDAELDEARLLQRDGSAWLAAYQAKLISEHGLPGIKVGFNRVFGYYIELTAAQARTARPPESFARKQTLKNAERYTTPELREFEQKVTTAEARALERERLLFEQLCSRVVAVVEELSAFAEVCAELDALSALAAIAHRRGWTRPEIVDEPVLSITQGRHPVLEETLGQDFVPNDTELGGEEGRLALITGPNMAGKSTYIRQVALLVLLAHVGSFVPASAARIGLCDRIFTRVGAEDALHAGQSTFMVEMTETAGILHHATERSLVILDEIGRGTSTLDGLSLAWAIAERLAQVGGGGGGVRTLFATHYHELTRLQELMPGRVRNLHVAVREWGEEIVFLHRILPGRTDRSYGIHVAKLAGLPASVVARAREVLDALAVDHSGLGGQTAAAAVKPQGSQQGSQLSLFTEYLAHPAVDALREVKLDSLSPMQAFDELRRLRELVEKNAGG